MHSPSYSHGHSPRAPSSAAPRAAGKAIGLAIGLTVGAVAGLASGLAWLCRRRRRATALLREHPSVVQLTDAPEQPKPDDDAKA